MWKPNAISNDWTNPANWDRSVPIDRLVAVVYPSQTPPRIETSVRLLGMMVQDSATVFIGQEGQVEILDSLVNRGSIRITDSASTSFKCDGSWIQTGEFEPGQSTVQVGRILSTSSAGSSFFNLLVPESTATRLSGSIRVNHMFVLDGSMNPENCDSVSILDGDTTAFSGIGMINGGTVIRAIDSTVSGTYRFGSPSTYVRFLRQGSIPSSISITVSENVNPDSTGDVWSPVPSHADPERTPSYLIACLISRDGQFDRETSWPSHQDRLHNPCHECGEFGSSCGSGVSGYAIFGL